MAIWTTTSSVETSANCALVNCYALSGNSMVMLTIFGFGMFVLGSIMLFNPIMFANGINKFSNKDWFHTFEITSRLLIGVLFIVFAENSSYPRVLYILGVILCFVSVFLLVIGENRHKRFARLTSKIGVHFRPIGLFAQICGIVLMYIGVG